MKRFLCLLFTSAAMLAACSGEVEATSSPPTLGAPSRTPPPTATPIATAQASPGAQGELEGLPLPMERGEFFAASGVCAVCHREMVDEEGQDVSIDMFWRATMMGNAARDPYWQATVRSEVGANPAAKDVIEDKCATCHTPMARFTLTAQGEKASLLDEGLLSADNALHTLAIDGVSCTLCHQIQEERLGLPNSFSGGFVIDSQAPSGERLVYGPYDVDEEIAQSMQSSSGFEPVQGLHLSRPELCASCHTLYTPTIDASGKIVGQFPEQMAYFEWFYSDYRRSSTCQECHMPEAKGGVRAAITSQILRSPFSQHVFVGGNAYMLGVLEAFGAELGVTASGEQLEGSIERTLTQLQEHAASVSLERVHRSGGRLIADVVVESMAGHKFPTGFPSRRAWLHLVVTDAGGAVVFESGALNADGSIAGNANDEDPTTYEPHYTGIGQADQVQIYEAILADSEGQVTTHLLRGASYLKDNRLLPSGSEKTAPYPDIAVRGRAREDEDFQGGGDKIEYAITIGDAQGPLTVTVELLYQSVGFRWAQNLRQAQGFEVERFLSYYETVPNQAVVVSSASATVGE
jgi:hypothetical protein